MRPEAQAFVFGRAIPYPLAAAALDRLVDARIRKEIPDTILFLEHEPVVTLGTSGNAKFLLKSEEDLKREGVLLAQSTRGGDITYHGPGQLVVYPVIALDKPEADAHKYMSCLEETAIRTCADYGITAYRIPGKTGAWTDKGKIAAMGVRLRKWVTSHGMSFNASVDLGFTKWIVPCGLVGQNVTSLKQILKDACPSMSDVRKSINAHLSDTLKRDIRSSDASLPDALSELSPYL